MNVQTWSLLLGVLTPVIVAVVHQPRWSKRTRQIMAVGIAVAVGIVNVIVQGVIDDWSDTFTVLATVAGASQAAYVLLWGPSGLTDRLEHATVVGGDPVIGEDGHEA